MAAPAEPFRRCRVCGQAWSDWEAFLLDPHIVIIGLQAVPSAPEASVLVFLHEGCGSISVKMDRLRQIPGLEEPAEAAGEACDGCFRDLGELMACDKPCEVASDRRLTRRILELKSRG